MLSFNVRYGTAPDGRDAWPHRAPRVKTALERLAPDLAGLQEALRFQLDELREALPGHGERGVAREDGDREGEYAPILYRRERLRPLGGGTFWFSETPERPGSVAWGARHPRICTWARFRIVVPDAADARRLYHYNLHWSSTSARARERSAELLLERIRTREHPEDPVVVTGDFNADEGEAAFRRLLAGGLEDTFRALHSREGRVGTHHRFRGGREGPKIDAILVGSGWTVRAAGIDRGREAGRWPSDHYPVTARLTWSRPSSPSSSSSPSSPLSSR